VQQPVELPLDCSCVASWSAEFSFEAVASLSTLFVCETEPSSPGLRTRIETLVLLGCVCAAPDAASAAWSLEADWSAVCTPVDGGGVAAPATCTHVTRVRTQTVSTIKHRCI
jgi:hypothetical protein